MNSKITFTLEPMTWTPNRYAIRTIVGDSEPKLLNDQLTKAKALLVFGAYVSGALLAGASVSVRKCL